MKEESVGIIDKFNVFCDEINYLADLLSLKGWNITIDKEDEQNNIGENYARVYYNLVAMKATIIFSDKNYDRSDDDIRKTARHEMIHLLLADLTVLASARTWDEDLFESAEHKVIHKLISVIKEA